MCRTGYKAGHWQGTALFASEALYGVLLPLLVFCLLIMLLHLLLLLLRHVLNLQTGEALYGVLLVGRRVLAAATGKGPPPLNVFDLLLLVNFANSNESLR
jgi:hypothetical protein